MDESNQVSNATEAKDNSPVADGALSIGLSGISDVFFFRRHEIFKGSEAFVTNAIARCWLVKADRGEDCIHHCRCRFENGNSDFVDNIHDDLLSVESSCVSFPPLMALESNMIVGFASTRFMWSGDQSFHLFHSAQI